MGRERELVGDVLNLLSSAGMILSGGVAGRREYGAALGHVHMAARLLEKLWEESLRETGSAGPAEDVLEPVGGETQQLGKRSGVGGASGVEDPSAGEMAREGGQASEDVVTGRKGVETSADRKDNQSVRDLFLEEGSEDQLDGATGSVGDASGAEERVSGAVEGAAPERGEVKVGVGGVSSEGVREESASGTKLQVGDPLSSDSERIKVDEKPDSEVFEDVGDSGVLGVAIAEGVEELGVDERSSFTVVREGPSVLADRYSGQTSRLDTFVRSGHGGGALVDRVRSGRPFSKSLSINDRIRFTRELVGGDGERFRVMLAELDGAPDLASAVEVVMGSASGAEETSALEEFLEMLDRRF